MIKELSTLDLYYLVKEFQEIINSKVDQIYQPNELLIRFHNSKFGKKILRISSRFIFISDFKGEQPQNPKTFCTILRKNLNNSRIRKIEQVGFERIIKIEFEKEKKHNLYIELFSKGNIVLTDENNIIINQLKTDKGRNIFRGNEYELPKKDADLLNMKESEFKKIIKESDETLVKTLAKKLSLGGMYSEYALKDFDKNIISKDLKTKEISKLYKEVSKLKNKEICPSLLKKRPVPFETEEKLDYETFNDALAEILTKELKKENEENKIRPYLNKKAKLETIINTQKKSIKDLEKKAKQNKEIGEKIYLEYNLINNILTEIEKAKTKYSMEEIKEKLKGHKIIKKITHDSIEIEIK